MSDDLETRIDVFVDRYTPSIRQTLRAARTKLRALFPRGHELVFDNYNALVFGISATGRTSDAFVSIAAYPKWVTLFFVDGVRLADPKGLLVGDGKQVRSVRLSIAADLDDPDIRALIAAAVLPWQEAFAAAAPLTTEIRMEVAKQRPRRPPSRAR